MLDAVSVQMTEMVVGHGCNTLPCHQDLFRDPLSVACVSKGSCPNKSQLLARRSSRILTRYTTSVSKGAGKSGIRIPACILQVKTSSNLKLQQ